MTRRASLSRPRAQGKFGQSDAKALARNAEILERAATQGNLADAPAQVSAIRAAFADFEAAVEKIMPD